MKLYVGNMPYTAAETDIESFFKEQGVALDSLSLMRDRFTGNSRGFAFVEIYDDEAALQAIENCNGKDCQGRPLVINEARPRTPSFGGPGGPGGPGGGEGGFDRGPGGGGDRPPGRGKGGKGGSRRNKRDKTRERW